MTKKTKVAKAKKGSVYDNNGGGTLLLDPSDPKYRKPKTPAKPPKVVHIEVLDVPKPKVKRLQGKTRPIAGFLLSPYIVLRPCLRALGWIGNKLYDNVFEINKEVKK